MLQRLLYPTSLTGGQWLAVLGLSLVTPVAVGIDKAIQLRPQASVPARAGGAFKTDPAVQANV